MIDRMSKILKDRFVSGGKEINHTEACTAIDEIMFILSDWDSEFSISLVELQQHSTSSASLSAKRWTNIR